MRNPLYQTRFYRIWTNMKTRCYNTKSPNFGRYGGRGIKVCDRWKKFSAFTKDMYSSYKEGLTLERITNLNGYSIENCRWATYKEQARNSKNFKEAARYTFRGRILNIMEWSELLSIKRTTLGMRLQKYNWSVERALGGVSYR